MRIARVGALALAAMPAAARDRDPLAGRIAGTPVDCVDIGGTGSGLTIIDTTTILYRTSGRRIWRTGPQESCAALRPLAVLIVEPWGSRVCRGDRFRTIDPPGGIPSAYCRFSAFVPYDPAK